MRERHSVPLLELLVVIGSVEPAHTLGTAMSSQLPRSPWIHIGECPLCVNGLCRIRCCLGGQGPHLYAMCDECEALWVQPTTDSPWVFPEAEHPECPLCHGPLYGPQAHWAQAQEVDQPEWSSVAIFDIPSSSAGDDASYEESSRDLAPSEEFVTPDDIADSLDAPAIPVPSSDGREHRGPAGTGTTVDDPIGRETDAAYGEDEPKPGC